MIQNREKRMTTNQGSGNPKKKNDAMLDDPSFCSVTNPITGQYIDLSQLSSSPNTPTAKKQYKGSSNEPKTRWLVKGYGSDIDKNFTISICSSPVVKDDKDISSSKLTNMTGAYYSFNDTKQNEINTVSIGDFNTQPKLLGNKKLTLQYEEGSICPNGVDHKSTLLNFVCDRDIITRAQINYIGNSHNCSYFFEVRSIYACPTANKKNEVNVIGIFFGIILVFSLVELCRRWIKTKIEQNLRNNNNNNNNNINNNGSRDGIANYRTELGSEPQWEFLEDRTVIGKWFQRLQGWVRRGNRYNNNSMGSIRMNNPSLSFRNSSTNSFFRDMETQNDILDQLDDLNGTQSNSVRSSVYTDVSVSPP